MSNEYVKILQFKNIHNSLQILNIIKKSKNTDNVVLLKLTTENLNWWMQI